MAQTRDIKYINREFNDFRTQLVEFAKSYFPDTYNDFSPTSPGMMFMEMAAYVGDVLAFYQDTQLQETFLTHAKDPKNLFNLAYMMGYRPKITGVSEAEITITQKLPATGSNYLPDFTQAAKINANATMVSSDSSNTNFFIPNSIDFNFSSSYDPTTITIDSLDSSNNPSQYNLIKKAKAISGKIETKSFDITTSEKFKTITLSDNNIVQIISVTDSDDNEYYEVPFLGQDTIFLDETNSSDDSDQVPYVLTLRKVPRRYVTRFRSNGNLDIQFGAGTLEDDDTTFLPDATNIGNVTNQGSLNFNGSGSVNINYDPTNFTYSKSYGMSPNNTTLTVRYLKGGGVSANVPANTLTSVTSALPAGNFTFTNEVPAKGGRDGDSIEELRENALRAFNEQGRAVTLQDYTVRALSLPSQYGSIAKAYVTQDQLTNTNTRDSIIDNNPLALSLYVLSYDNNKNFNLASSTLKQNLKTYLKDYMILSDSINIKDAFIVNVAINYEIILRPTFASRDVLLRCNIELTNYFSNTKRNINQPINLSELYTLLDKVKGVQTVQKVEIVNKQGGNYSQYAYDVKGATRDNVVYPSYDPCIFEVKFPNQDIKGRVINI